MKVVAINGSPHKNGNTYHALSVAGEQLKADGIDFEIIHVGNRAVSGCIACGKCRQTQDERCSITTDPVNQWIQILKQADGIILAAPVHYAGIAGTMKCVLDRLFYVSGSNGNFFRHKVGASLVAVRRSGGSITFDSLNHYLLYSEMLVAPSNYWNIIHGRTPGEVLQDHEGVQIVQVMARNMAWILKMREQTKDALPEPEQVSKVMTNFVR